MSDFEKTVSYIEAWTNPKYAKVLNFSALYYDYQQLPRVRNLRARLRMRREQAKKLVNK